MNSDSKYIDEVFHFAGQWDMPSLCGLKIISKSNESIILVTNLYEQNPWTSISRWAAELAMIICDSYQIDPGKMTFIEHNPDKQSSLDFYRETFHKVVFNSQYNKLSNPEWHQITKDEADQMLFNKGL